MPLSEITVQELADRMALGACLIDVRQPDEYRGGHVPGAVLIPLDQVPDRHESLQQFDQVLLVCHSGGRSLAAAQFLSERGIEAVNVAGGTSAWIDSGRDVVQGDQPG